MLLNFYNSFAWKMLIGSYLIAIIGGLALFSYEQYGAQKVLVAEVGNTNKVVAELTDVAKQ